MVLVWGDLLLSLLCFVVFFIWVVSVFFMVGVIFGNLNVMVL